MEKVRLCEKLSGKPPHHLPLAQREQRHLPSSRLSTCLSPVRWAMLASIAVVMKRCHVYSIGALGILQLRVWAAVHRSATLHSNALLGQNTR